MYTSISSSLCLTFSAPSCSSASSLRSARRARSSFTSISRFRLLSLRSLISSCCRLALASILASASWVSCRFITLVCNSLGTSGIGGSSSDTRDILAMLLWLTPLEREVALNVRICASACSSLRVKAVTCSWSWLLSFLVVLLFISLIRSLIDLISPIILIKYTYIKHCES